VALLPWFIPLLGSLLVITYVPQIVLWLPQQFY
jgi:TRAP-type C4-dicarboxylate transport system permease large subunit